MVRVESDGDIGSRKSELCRRDCLGDSRSFSGFNSIVTTNSTRPPSTRIMDPCACIPFEMHTAIPNVRGTSRQSSMWIFSDRTPLQFLPSSIFLALLRPTVDQCLSQPETHPPCRGSYFSLKLQLSICLRGFSPHKASRFSSQNLIIR